MNKIRVTTSEYEYMGLQLGSIHNLEGKHGKEVYFTLNGKSWALSEGEYQIVNLKTEDKQSPTSATDFLSKALDLLQERGKDYDQPEGERSMGKTVQAFNAITGHSLKESEGWLILQLLKDVRQWSNPDSYHADSAEDCISYAALKAEALVEGK